MSLDNLYDTIKNATYPIHDRKELLNLVKGLRIKFEHDHYDAQDIATMIHDYPIKDAAHLIELFIYAAEEEYSYKLAEEMKKVMK